MPDLYTATPLSASSGGLDRIPENTNPIGSFLLRPVGFSFENQREKENIILLLRRHWSTNSGWLTLGIILFFVPLVFNKFPVISVLSFKYQLLVFIGWYLLLIAYFFERFLDWYYNVGIITDQRVVDIDFYGLLYKEISDAEFDKIQDVTQQQIGAVRTVLDFGNILIQTAAETQKVEFEDIPHPSQVAELLHSLT